jgi:hypothetical protein
MITGIKCYIILVLASLTASEWICHSDEYEVFCKQSIITGHDDCGFLSCLPEICRHFLPVQSSGTEDEVTGFDENDSDTYRKNRNTPDPCAIEISVRTADYSPHFKPNLNNRNGLKEQLDVWCGESLPYQRDLNDIFIPDLKYYIYALEKIVT